MDDRIWVSFHLGSVSDHITSCLKHVYIQPETFLPVCGIFQTTSPSELFPALLCGSAGSASLILGFSAGLLLIDLFGPTSPARPLVLSAGDGLVFSLWLCALKLCGKAAPALPCSCNRDLAWPSLPCFLMVWECVGVSPLCVD